MLRPFRQGVAGKRSFEQIYDDLIPNLNRLLRYYRHADMDIPDLIATTFMRLWMNLSAEPTMLEKCEKGDALQLLLNRTCCYFYQRMNQREIYLDDLATRSGDPDEFFIDGHDHSHINDHAAYAEAVDIRVDIESAVV